MPGILDEAHRRHRERERERERVNNATLNLPPLTEIVWHSYTISSVFEILPGKRLESRNRKPGRRPFIGALDNSNGIAGFVKDANSSLDRNVLGVNYNGNGVCLGFYHPYECIFSDDVKRFRLKNHAGGEYTYLFLKVAIQQQKSKFGYLYKFNSTRMAKQAIMLPADDDGQPDYTYMEAYGCELALRILRKQLGFIES
ncbi:MAG: restriction endonuclease [Coriobacteriaceae bacterium]|nr:restriction endonuclease [Coriobacteriaceae bacterium]